MNVIVTSHATLCDGLVAAFNMLVSSNSDHIHCLGLTEEGVGEFRSRLRALCDELLRQGDVLIMSDLLGGTPYNEANIIFQENPDHVRLVAGTNFPMLIEVGLLIMDECSLEDAYQTALLVGRQGVVGAKRFEDKGDETADADLF